MKVRGIRSWGSPLRAWASFRRRAPVYVRTAGRMCSYTLGRDDPEVERERPALRALDDVFLSKENRNFYIARLGISPERAAPSIDKPSGRICTRHIGKSDVYPPDTLEIARSPNVCEWMKCENVRMVSENVDNNTRLLNLLIFLVKTQFFLIIIVE